MFVYVCWEKKSLSIRTTVTKDGKYFWYKHINHSKMHKIFRISCDCTYGAHVHVRQFIGAWICCLCHRCYRLFLYFCFLFLHLEISFFFLIFLLAALAIFTYFNEIFLYSFLILTLSLFLADKRICTHTHTHIVYINNTSCSKKFNNTRTCIIHFYHEEHEEALLLLYI